MADEVAAGELIEARLAQLLNRRVPILSYRQMGHGISGAATYWLSFRDGEAVLKITSASSPAYVRARAGRELAFYRELADRVPLRVPRAIAMHAGAEGSALLLTAYQPSPPPDHWPERRYLEAAQQLGRFHAASWDNTATLAHLRWVLRPGPGEVHRDMRRARGYWRTLRAKPQLASILTEHVYRWVQRLVAAMPAVEAIIRSLPLTLCHGDCNPGNVLFDADGAMVWADWQEARLARGPEDLSFFLQQAAIAGGVVASDAALSAYRESLVAELHQDVTLGAIRRVVDAAELRSRCLHWPAYLANATAAELEAMLERLRGLAERLQLEM